jgi:MraZ protein
LENLFLFGHYPAAIDTKHRVLVPAPIRRRINPESHGKDFFLVIGENRRPWLFPNKFYEELAGSKRSELTPGPETAEFDRMNFGMAQFVELDAQGRILVPMHSLEWMGLEKAKEIYLVGVRDHIELWDKAEWENERNAMAARPREIWSRARQAQQNP